VDIFCRARLNCVPSAVIQHLIFGEARKFVQFCQNVIIISVDLGESKGVPTIWNVLDNIVRQECR
jgi:hypothetical protein